MAKDGGLGLIVAEEAPPPDKIGKGEPSADDEAAEEKEARVNAMAGLASALGLKGIDMEAACDALDDYLATAGYSRG